MTVRHLYAVLFLRKIRQNNTFYFRNRQISTMFTRYCLFSTINVLDRAIFVCYHKPAIANNGKNEGVDIMIYHTSSSDLPNIIDRYITGRYGEDRITEKVKCDRCGGVIKRNDSYYLLDSAVYCMDCGDYAEAHILRDVCENYIYVL